MDSHDDAAVRIADGSVVARRGGHGGGPHCAGGGGRAALRGWNGEELASKYFALKSKLEDFLTCRECERADDIADCARRKGDGDAFDTSFTAVAPVDGCAEDTEDALEAADVALSIH